MAVQFWHGTATVRERTEAEAGTGPTVLAVKNHINSRLGFAIEHLRSPRLMIKLTRLNHVPLIVNSDLIEHIETTPDTVITLTSGQKLMVLETAEDVVEKVIDFRRALQAVPRTLSAPPGEFPADVNPSPQSHGR